MLLSRVVSITNHVDMVLMVIGIGSSNHDHVTLAYNEVITVFKERPFDGGGGVGLKID